MRYIKYIISAVLLAGIISCRTMDLEKEGKNALLPDKDKLYIEDKKTDGEQEKIVYVDPPEIRYTTEENSGTVLSGSDALKQNLLDISVEPEYESGHLKSWVYRKGSIYEVHCQTYHSTLIQLEPGEEMLEVPYISEPDVWRLSRGVGTEAGQAQQYVILKPDFSKLTSTLIIVTNRRVYQMEIKSFTDHYMPTVSWVYPKSVSDNPSWISFQQQKAEKETEKKEAVIQYPSTDYRMYVPLFHKPVWTPKYVYDDGSKTYFVLDERCLHTELPALFNKNRTLINYRVNRNILIVDQLIEKVELRLGKRKVTVEKKKVHGKAAQAAAADTAEQKASGETAADGTTASGKEQPGGKTKQTE